MFYKKSYYYTNIIMWHKLNMLRATVQSKNEVGNFKTKWGGYFELLLTMKELVI